MNIKKTLVNYIAFLIAFVLAFLGGFLLHAKMYPTSAHFPVLSEAYKLISDHGYDEVPEAPAMEYGAIHGMVSAYEDPYTRFVEPVQAELNSDRLSGSYGGIGAQMDRDADGYVVLHPFPESPASEIGIQDGDRLIKVDNLKIKPDTPMDDVVAAVRGPEGQKVYSLLLVPRIMRNLSSV